MKDLLPTARDVKVIAFKAQRRKNLLPEHAVLTSVLNSEITNLREALFAEKDEEERKTLNAQLHDALVRKRNHEEEGFESLALELRNYIVDQPGRIRLYHRTRPEDGRQLMRFESRRRITTLFDRYVALLLTRTFQVKLHGRDQLIRSLLNTLRITVRGAKSKAHRSVIQLDITEFFGSIDHEVLLKKLRSHAGVPRFALRHVESILDAYSRITGRRVGLPQGVPSSSVLSEIYLENLDHSLKRHSSVVFYGRYVDDIIVVCQSHDADKVELLINQGLNRIGLTKSGSKSNTHYYPAGKPSGFDYLGYGFEFDNNTGQLSSVDLSKKKLERYKSGFKNLAAHLTKVTCGADRRGIDLLLEGVSYLFEPKATVADGDSLRIVTGLAYSSRFIQQEELKAPRLDGYLRAASAQLQKGLDWVAQCGPPSHPKCYCCQRDVYKFHELSRLAKIQLTQKTVLGSNAIPHSDEKIRREVARLLWNLHVAK